MSFEVTVTPTVYNVEVEVNPSVQPFDVQVITQQDLADLVDEAKQYAEDAEDSADSASASASSASASASASASSANSASASASSASGSANTATTQAGIATTQAGIATTQAGIATTKAQEASQSASDALASEQASAQSASDALQSEQNALASEQASALSEANALASEQSASASASTATAQAGIATTQAGIATTQAGNALTSANNALNSANAAAASAASAAQVGTSTLLTGFTTDSNTTIAGTDTILQAFQKAQGQINARVSGTGTSGQVGFWTGTGTQAGDNGLTWDNATKTLLSISEVGIFNRGTNSATLFSSQNSSATGNPTQFRILHDGASSAIDSIRGALLIRTNSVNRIIIDRNSGNVMINTTTDAGFRLDVNGTARVQGALTVTTGADVTPLTISGYSLTGANAQSALSITGTWNTTGTPTALLVDVTDTASNINSNLFRFRRNNTNVFFSVKDIGGLGAQGVVSLGGYGFGTGLVAIYGVNSTNIPSNSPVSIRFSDNLISESGYSYNFFSGQYSSKTFTSGIGGFINILRGFAPTSGTGILNVIALENTINQTGGANGITRGLFVNPTLTSAADWRSIEWSNNSGRGLWGAGTANNALAGATHIGSASNANASAILELTSTTRGLLLPRMTSAQRDAIASPVAGLIVYNTTANQISFYNGTAWTNL
jgi:hypothetical protein